MIEAKNLYYIRLEKFDDGERMPFLMSSASRMPIQSAAFWIIGCRRSGGLQSKTLENDLRALMFLFLWADLRNVDISERISTGRFFSLTEIMDIDSVCGWFVRELVTDLALARAKVARISSKRLRRAASFNEKFNRLTAIHSFLDFTSAEVVSALRLKEEAWGGYDKVREDCLKRLMTYRDGLIRPEPDDDGAPQGLEDPYEKRLREVIEPDCKDNPFTKKVRFRNYVIVKMLLDLGIRVGELLGILTTDCALGSDGLVTIHRRPDNKNDPRKRPGAAKTLARTLGLSPRLAEIIHEWIVVHRPKINMKDKDRLFLIIDVFNGAPLTHSAINKMFAKLREKVGGLPAQLTPHVMRHTANDNFTEFMDKKQVPETKQVKLRKRAFGWRSENSAETYLRRSTTRKSNEYLKGMQSELDIKHGRKDDNE